MCGSLHELGDQLAHMYGTRQDPVRWKGLLWQQLFMKTLLSHN